MESRLVEICRTRRQAFRRQQAINEADTRMNTDSRTEMPLGLIRRSWTALSAFLRDLESDYSEADYILERVSRLERDFAELKRSLSEKDAATSAGGSR
jgi:hypothetical protein